MRTGTIVGRFCLGPQIGQGAFGKIFAARDTETGLLYAIKNESATAERRTLIFETKILRRIQSSPYFPRFFDSGQYNSFDWIAMELVGPSISAVIKHTVLHKLSISTVIRASIHALRGIQSLHELGFIHRDIKPANMLIRLSKYPNQPPICLIDFGLVRIYRDQKTGQHIKPRPRTGFRGTKTYASLNAHAGNDLSRRDDLISWFYFVLDALLGDLPWKGNEDNTDIAMLKSKYDVKAAVEDVAPQLFDIWQHITSLNFEDDPNYQFILQKLNEIMSDNHIIDDDKYDWDEYMSQYRRQLTNEFGVALRIDGGADIQPYYTELGVPPTIMKEMSDKKRMYQPLLQANVPKYHGKNYSIMQYSELNEKDDKCGCC
ncbi:CK1 family protein kinase [Histomonas meleagridis]|uniref:CK1 family protein kinase n=1 Tax=Histomonas meleagridis TaxID=135588 RepID=UPI00355A4903|nr:CK1 family protein kinase [Histomonas meleagridis]KAH0805181.1 CK1 family protein kinase [Histomonas meleagridis]